MDNQIPIITIDGPSGVGKSVISKRVSRSLGWHLLESGKLYRVFSMLMVREDVSPEDEQALVALTQRKIEFVQLPNDDLTHVLLEGQDVTSDLMTEKTAMLTSTFSALLPVRNALIGLQRKQAKLPGLVCEGRDMGTHIFPNATCKIFLTADVEIRARWRYEQLIMLGKHVNINDIIDEVEARDKQDTNRDFMPLRPADDAHIINTSAMTLDDVESQVLSIISSYQ